MTHHVDLLIVDADQVVTCAGSRPKRGAEMLDVGLIPNGAIAIKDGVIVAVGETADLQAHYTAEQTISAAGRAVVPGFVDPHTHVVYAGQRVAEFELRIKGATYLEIMAAGGGIVSTMRSVRSASVEQLVAETRPRLDEMLRLGTTTLEIKTGYGLDTASELAMLEAIAQLDQTHVVDIVPTFLGAHAIPPEFKGREDDYTKLVVEEMLPAAADWYQKSHFAQSGQPLFNDVFCEKNAFTLAQTRQILEAGLTHGFPVKIHADEFTALGGVALAVELKGVSADHLDVTAGEELHLLAQSDTIAVLLPAVNFNLGSTHFANGRGLIDAGGAVALSTDINPGSAPCPSMPLVMAMACRYQKLLPAEALNASTLNAAHAIGLGDVVGSLEVGKQADLLILSQPDYRYLMYEFGGNVVQTVIKKGGVVVG